MRISSDVAFTPTVKAVQAKHGSRRAYEKMERSGGFATALDEGLVDFIGEQRSFFLATANREGQPYIQHRGGPPGFLRVLDPHTLAFADLSGNRQYISVGNLADNDKVHLFLIDYTHRQRVKIWGTAKVVEDAELIRQVMPGGVRARGERAIVVSVTAWDANCPQHIPLRLEAEVVEKALAERDQRIAELERQVAALQRR